MSFEQAPLVLNDILNIPNHLRLHLQSPRHNPWVTDLRELRPFWKKTLESEWLPEVRHRLT